MEHLLDQQFRYEEPPVIGWIGMNHHWTPEFVHIDWECYEILDGTAVDLCCHEKITDSLLVCDIPTAVLVFE